MVFSTDTQRLSRRLFPHLDASRLMAFFPVFATHCFITHDGSLRRLPLLHFVQSHAKLGLLALDYFFVLSAFLITWMLLEEASQRDGNFRLGRFYMRRALRIFPLYFLVIIMAYAGWHMAIQLFNANLSALPPFAAFALFWSNFWMVEHGHDFLFCLTFFWSVAVEEQFYVGWALLLYVRLKLVLPLSLALVMFSILFRAAYRFEDAVLSFHTVSALGNFGWGGLLAYTAFYKPNWLRIWQDFPRAIRLAPWILLAVSAMGYPYFFSSGWPLVLERSWFAGLFVLLLVDWIGPHVPVVNLESFKVLGFWGRRSFGLYVWHGVVLMVYAAISRELGLEGSLAWVVGIGPALCLAATFVLAGFSYRWYEARFLVLKDRFA